MGITLEDIVSGKPRIRTKTVNYGDGLVFEIKTFTAAAFQDMFAEMSARNQDDVDGGDDFSAEVAIRFIEGQDCKPTKSQIDAFKNNLDVGVIQKLVVDGIRFNGGAEDIAAAAKKS